MILHVYDLTSRTSLNGKKESDIYDSDDIGSRSDYFTFWAFFDAMLIRRRMRSLGWYLVSVKV